jgi:predicted dehydrogenase
MALSVAECDRMLAAQRRSGKQLMIAQCLRFWPAYEALLAAIREGTYGRLQSLAMDRIGGYARWGMDSWFNDARRSGGAILDLHLHDVDWALHALGAPAGLFAAGRPGHTRGIDDVTAVWDYDGGPIVTIRGSWMYAGFLMTFRALFDEGVLEFGFPPDRSLRLLTRESREATPLDISGESAYVREMRYFLDCVQGRRVNTLCTPESTRESIGMVMREHEAIAARARVAPDAGRAG